MTSATERIRALLDERGVEWGNIRNDGSESDYLTEWQFENNQGKAIAIEWAVGSGLSVEIHRYHLTPEQAIAATLRQAVRHPKPYEKWTTVLLPEIAWSWDDSWPDYLSVAHNAHGEWRTYVPEATLGAGSCKRVMDSIDPFAMWVCDHCGHPLDTSENFCGGCGREVVDA